MIDREPRRAPMVGGARCIAACAITTCAARSIPAARNAERPSTRIMSHFPFRDTYLCVTTGKIGATDWQGVAGYRCRCRGADDSGNLRADAFPGRMPTSGIHDFAHDQPVPYCGHLAESSGQEFLSLGAE